MKNLVLFTLGGMLLVNVVAVAEPNPSDQKWLATVEKMVAKGETRLSTPKENRVTLLKTWGKEKGYSVKVTKMEAGYRVELVKLVAQK